MSGDLEPFNRAFGDAPVGSREPGSEISARVSGEPVPASRVLPENVLDYPRSPAGMRFPGRVRVIHRGATIADTTAAIRVIETGHAPTFYIPPADVDTERLSPGTAQSFSQWMGVASYWSVFTRGLFLVNCAWSYEAPPTRYERIRGYFAFYPQLMEECWVDDERVVAVPGSYYGGWITSAITGPVQGGPGPGN